MTDAARTPAAPLDICVDRYPGGAKFDPAQLPKDIDDAFSADPRELALAWNRRWETGQTLRLRFLDGDETLQQRVMDSAREWLEFANLEFEVGRFVDAEIRISFKGDGYWSDIGTDALLESDRDGPTMNFGGFTTATDETVFRRTVLHEFGHAIGCIHEQASPAAEISWDDAKVYAYFRRFQKWDKETTFQNVLVRYSPENLRFTRHDPTSIMQYPVSAELTRNGFSIPWNDQLSEMDRSFIAKMYPGRPVTRTTSHGSKGGKRVVTRAQAMKDAEAALDQSSADTVPIDREALRSLINGPTQDTSNDLWRWLVPGLLLLVLVSLVGLLWLIGDGNETTNPELALTAFTALLTGLLALFIRAPAA